MIVSPLHLANAPTSWGIEKPSSPEYPPWCRVLDEVAEAGYGGIELGPLGYLPTARGTLTAALDDRQLSLVAGTLMKPLHVRGQRPPIIAAAKRVCRTLAEQRAPYLVVISAITPERAQTAGRSKAAKRLTPSELRETAETIKQVASVAWDHEVIPTVHTHAGTYLEFIDELEALSDLVGDSVRYCVDTGHCAYAGIDPAKLIDALGQAVAYVHLKDVNQVVLDRVRNECAGFWDAYRRGIFCVLGEGITSFTSVFDSLARLGYIGWLTVEQDALPGDNSSPLENATTNREFIARLAAHHQSFA